MIKDYLTHVKLFSANARLFLVGGIYNGIGFAVFQLLFNLYLKEYGYQEGQIGQILSFGAIGAAMVAIPAAFLIERIQIKKILVISMFLASLAYILQVYFKEIKLIIIFAFLANMFITVYRVAGAPFIMRNSNKRERIYLFGISSGVWMMSALLGSIAGGFLPRILKQFSLPVNLAYEISLYFSVGISFLSVIPFLKLQPKPIPKIKKRLLDQIRDYNWPLLTKMMIPKIMIGMGAGLVIPFMNLYFRNEFNLGPAPIGVIFAALQVVMFFGMISAPILTSRFGMLKSIVLTELISIPFMLILALTRQLPLAVIAFILRGALMNMNIPISQNFEMELVKEEQQPFTNALASLSWSGAWAVSTLFGGTIIEKYSFSFSFYITIILYLISAICYYLFFRRSSFQSIPEIKELFPPKTTI
ncbi:MAG: MFS transporter [Candidatus Cloacimonetes bacterium]|nr:MFS transporter [Candidatus Cloacimonadota bacterium]